MSLESFNANEMSDEEKEVKKEKDPHNSARRFGFSLTQEVKSPTMLKSMTRLPSSDTLKRLEELTPIIREQIRKTFLEIYSHVTQRGDPSTLQVFFHHVASTVLFEVGTGNQVKGKDHAKKAASILKMIDSTLKAIEEKIPSKLINEDQKETLKLFKSILTVHKNAFIFALGKTSDTTKEHLLKHQHQDISKEVITPLSPTKKELVKSCYPSPQLKAPLTPQRVTSDDVTAIEHLTLASLRKKLFECFSDESSSSESEEISPPKGNRRLPTRALSTDSLSGSESEDDFENDHSGFSKKSGSKDDLDDLCSGMDDLIFGGPRFQVSSLLKTTGPLPTKAKEQPQKTAKKKLF